METAVEHNPICRRQLRAAEYLRDNFDSVWDTMTAATIGEAWRQAEAAAASGPEAAVPAPGTGPVIIRLRLSHDERGRAAAEGPEQWRFILPTEALQCGKAADEAGPEDQAVAAGPSGQQQLATWRIPLGGVLGYVQVTAKSDGPGLWAIHCSLTDCKDATFQQEARIHVLTAEGQEMAQLALQDAEVMPLPLKTGHWRIEIDHARGQHSIEIDVGELSAGS